MDLHKIFLNDSLYTEYDINSFTEEELLNILFHSENSSVNKIKTLDSYCTICEKETTLISSDITTSNFREVLLQINERHLGSESNLNTFLEECGTFERIFKCPRPNSNSTHNHIYIFRIKNSKLIKIGQSPSVSDLAKKEIEKYRAFNENIYKELNRAIGLSSYGIGVGSFVYLRRIIEKHIVSPILQNLLEREEITQDDLYQSDFKKKIDLAKNHLPEFLVENKKIYSILSKGIHQLEEKECNDLFPILKTSIEIILDEKIERQKRELKNKQIAQQLNNFK